MRAFALCAVLILQGAVALDLRGAPPKNIDNHKCRVLCQRFGMKMLGDAFKGMGPTECMSKCNEVYPKKTSFIQTNPPAAVPATPKGKPNTGGEPAIKK